MIGAKCFNQKTFLTCLHSAVECAQPSSILIDQWFNWLDQKRFVDLCLNNPSRPHLGFLKLEPVLNYYLKANFVIDRKSLKKLFFRKGHNQNKKRKTRNENVTKG